MMDLKNYTLVAYKLIQRPWGPECRYTVARLNGSHINEVISIPNLKIDEMSLATLILESLKRVDIPYVLEPPFPQILTKESVEEYLRIEGYIKPEQTLEMVKTQMIKPIGMI